MDKSFLKQKKCSGKKIFKVLENHVLEMNKGVQEQKFMNFLNALNTIHSQLYMSTVQKKYLKKVFGC